MEDIQVDIERLIQNYNLKIAELMGRIIVLETHNATLYELLNSKEDTSTQEMDSVLKDAMDL